MTIFDNLYNMTHCKIVTDPPSQGDDKADTQTDKKTVISRYSYHILHAKTNREYILYNWVEDKD